MHSPLIPKAVAISSRERLLSSLLLYSRRFELYKHGLSENNSINSSIFSGVHTKLEFRAILAVAMLLVCRRPPSTCRFCVTLFDVLNNEVFVVR